MKGEGFDVMKSGDARVALIGFPSVGKVFQTHVLSVFFAETIASYDFLLFLCEVIVFIKFSLILPAIASHAIAKADQ